MLILGFEDAEKTLNIIIKKKIHHKRAKRAFKLVIYIYIKLIVSIQV